MKQFEMPEIEVVKFQLEDVITTSDTFVEDNTGEWT